MDYYILLPADTETDAMNETNLLGTTSFRIFWGAQGLITLMKISDENPEMLPHIRIITSAGDNISVEKFMNDIDKLEVRLNQE